MLSGKIKPLYNEEILDEYFDVLNRSKFHLSEIRIHELLNFFKENGIDSSRFPYDGEMPDEDDRVFYEVCLSKEDSFLVTGNLKHFPKEPQVITAAEMMEKMSIVIPLNRVYCKLSIYDKLPVCLIKHDFCICQ